MLAQLHDQLSIPLTLVDSCAIQKLLLLCVVPCFAILQFFQERKWLISEMATVHENFGIIIFVFDGHCLCLHAWVVMFTAPKYSKIGGKASYGITDEDFNFYPIRMHFI